MLHSIALLVIMNMATNLQEIGTMTNSMTNIVVSISPIEMEQKLFERINRMRVEKGMTDWKYSAMLEMICRLHSQEMMATGRISHYDLNGLDPFKRKDKYLIGLFTGDLGESIAFVQGTNADQIVDALIDNWFGTEEKMKRYLYNPQYSHIGVGVSTNATGYFITAYYAEIVYDATKGLNAQTVRERLFESINREREKQKLKPIRMNEELEMIAQEYAADMGEKKYLSLIDSKGRSYLKRIEPFGEFAVYKDVGENIASVKAFSEEEAVKKLMNVWLKPGRERANLFLSNYTDTGIGIYWDGQRFTISQIFCNFISNRVIVYTNTNVVEIVTNTNIIIPELDTYQIEREISELINGERVKNEKMELVINPALCELARIFSTRALEIAMSNRTVGSTNGINQNYRFFLSDLNASVEGTNFLFQTTAENSSIINVIMSNYSTTLRNTAPTNTDFGIGIAQNKTNFSLTIFVTSILSPVEPIDITPMILTNLLKELTRMRQENGVSRLVMNPELNRVATDHSTDMVIRNYISSFSKTGKSPSERRLTAYPQLLTVAAGESVFIVDGNSVDEIVSNAMSICRKRTDILDTVMENDFNQLGIGVIQSDQYYYITMEFTHSLVEYLGDPKQTVTYGSEKNMEFQYLGKLPKMKLQGYVLFADPAAKYIQKDGRAAVGIMKLPIVWNGDKFSTQLKFEQGRGDYKIQFMIENYYLSDQMIIKVK